MHPLLLIIEIALGNYFAHETALVEQPVEIGDNTKIWHFCHVMQDVRMGAGCSLGQNVFVGKGVVLGNNVKVQNNVSIYEGVICEDDVFLGPSMVFTNIRNPRSAVVRKGQYSVTYLEQGATIGANATIVCGTRLGRYCFIGAGTVVTKDVPAYALVVGNPGRQIGWMSEYGHRLHFDDQERAVCPESGVVYVRSGGRVSKQTA
ncbi:MAG: acyltransferase [Bacteroidia bacterium]